MWLVTLFLIEQVKFVETKKDEMMILWSLVSGTGTEGIAREKGKSGEERIFKSR